MITSVTNKKIYLHAVKPADLPKLMPLVQAFYQHFSYPFDLKEKMAALQQLVESRSIGRVWRIRQGDEDIGYVLLAFTFSLEYGGRVAMIDELYVNQEGRQTGIGSMVLNKVELICQRIGINIFQLETEPHNQRATALYNRLGYRDYGRNLLTKNTR